MSLKAVQTIATLLGATCCVRLATLLRHVGCCWLKFEAGQIFCATFVDVAWCSSHLARFVQQCCSWACALVRFSKPNMLQRSNRVAKHTQHFESKNVAICCVDILWSFGQPFNILDAATANDPSHKVFFCLLQMLIAKYRRLIEGCSQMFPKSQRHFAARTYRYKNTRRVTIICNWPAPNVD